MHSYCMLVPFESEWRRVLLQSSLEVVELHVLWYGCQLLRRQLGDHLHTIGPLHYILAEFLLMH